MFTVFLVGDSGVGKSTLLASLSCYGTFVPDLDPTVGHRKLIHTFFDQYNNPFTFIIVEYSGDFANKSIYHPFDSYDGGIFIADASRRSTIENIDVWKARFSCFDVPSVTAYNKADLLQKYDPMCISVKEGVRIKELFTALLRKITGDEEKRIF